MKNRKRSDNSGLKKNNSEDVKKKPGRQKMLRKMCGGAIRNTGRGKTNEEGKHGKKSGGNERVKKGRM